MRPTFTIAVLLALMALPAFAQSPEAATPPPPADDTSIHAFADRDKTCVAWTDQCRACTRHADGEVSCSNIGIACQPAAITCTTRQTDPPKQSEPPKPSDPPKQADPPR
jgi:hypothetical protein